MADHEFPPYVNIPPIAKTRSTSHLAPTPEHHRSVSYEETTTASTSTDSVPGVRIRSESSQVSQDFPSPAPRMYVAAYEYVAQREDELDLQAGSIVKLVDETNEDGWYRGELEGKVGMFPSNYARIQMSTDNLLEFKADEILLPDKNKHIDDFRIGHGATATVFKVDIDTTKRNLKTGRIADALLKDQRKAALKRFNRYGFTRGDVPEDEGQLKQVKREANLVNGLSHQNIVRLLGICLEDPFFGLLLELCEGSSLRAVCRGMDITLSIPLGVLIGWAGQIADGMEYLISQGYVHRDLKADNVLVKEEVCLCLDEETMKFDWCSRCGRRPLGKLQLKITDFGGSRKVTADANRFSTAGTYAWLAPEAFRDGAWSESSDVWSFGVVLWELLSREEPYQGQMPTAIAFLIAMKGQNLAINENCPEKWKNIMQHCWALEPKDRPTFAYLVKYFKDYAKELEDQNKQIQRAPSMMAVKEIYTNCFVNQHKELEKMFNDLYSGAGMDINRKDRKSIAPETKARKNKNHKGKKLEITGPMGDVKHILSVQKTNDTNFKIKYNEISPGGTLPRLNDRQSTLSISSPDLFASAEQVSAGFSTVGHGTASRISRQRAIRKKKTNPNMYESPVVSPTYDESSLFAKIDNADEEASVSTKEHKNGTLSKVWSKFHPWRSHKRDSKDDEDKAGSISSRSSSTTSSNRIITGPASRSAVASSFLDAGAGARTRAQSAADCGDDTGISRRNKVSPSDKRPVKHTNATERFVKEPEILRPSILPPHHRKSALDQTIPASPNSPDSGLNTSFPPMGVHSRRTTAGSSCDGAPSYEMLVTNPSGMGHGHKSHVLQPSLSDYVPIAAEQPTHYMMKGGMIFGSNGHAHGGHGHGKPTYYPVGGGCDDYIQVAGSGMKPTVGEVNNSPYSERAAHFYSRNVQNPQYVHCAKQQKLPTPPIKIQSESNLVATGLGAGSGASTLRPNQLTGNHVSSLSLNEPPDIPAPLPPRESPLVPPPRVSPPAPLPPRVSMSPPVGLAPCLPPRDGSLSPAPRTMLMNKEILKKPDPVVF